jgi:hypothetical protein
MTLALLLPSLAQAQPEDLSLSSMQTWHDERVIADLHPDYLQLVRELGTVVANKPFAPPETLGAYGFDFEAANTFVFTTPGADGAPNVWEEANVDEQTGAFQVMPQVTARKGLPMSLEIGGNAGWMGFSHQGTFGGFGRVGLVEGYKPWPDVTVQVGYSGYVGNDELELGVLDLGVELGSSYAFGSLPGINNAQFAPYLSYQYLTVHAAPVLDPAVAAAVGATSVGRSSDPASEKAIGIHQVGAGFQVTNGTVLLRLIGTWAPDSVAQASIGMGFTY